MIGFIVIYTYMKNNAHPAAAITAPIISGIVTLSLKEEIYTSENQRE
jgi:hypothetical protein